MKLEYKIKLSRIERICLQRIKGFNHPFEQFVSWRDIEKEKPQIEPGQFKSFEDFKEWCEKEMLKVGWVNCWGIVPAGRNFLAEDARIEEQRKPVIAQMGEIRKKYLELARQSRELVPYKDLMSQEDAARTGQLYNQNELLNEARRPLERREHKRRQRILRRLYGIVSIVRGNGVSHKYFYRYFIMPKENVRATRTALEAGVFSKELDSEDISLLEFLSDRTKKIMGRKTRGYFPRFAISLIQRDYSRLNQEQLVESLHRLTGVLCHSYGPETYRKGHIGSYMNFWQFPFTNLKLAEMILVRENDSTNRFEVRVS